MVIFGSQGEKGLGGIHARMHIEASVTSLRNPSFCMMFISMPSRSEKSGLLPSMQTISPFSILSVGVCAASSKVLSMIFLVVFIFVVGLLS